MTLKTKLENIPNIPNVVKIRQVIGSTKEHGKHKMRELHYFMQQITVITIKFEKNFGVRAIYTQVLSL